MFTITIGKAEAICGDKITLTSGMVKAVRVAFVFSEEWENFDKIVVFSNGAETLDVSLGEDNTCYIPHEMMADAGRDVTCGVYGYKGEGSKRVAIPTVKCSLGKVVEGVNPSGEEPTDPTITVWGEVIAKVNEHDEAIKNPYYTEDVKLTEVTTAVGAYEGVDIDISDTVISSASADFTIDVQGDVKFECVCSGIPDDYATFYVDGEMVAQCTDGENFSYEGHVGQNIKVRCNFMSVTFTEFVTKTCIKDAIGDMDKALDELHNYAQSLIGGEA